MRGMHRSGSVCLDVINQSWSPMYDLTNIFEVFLPQLLTYPNPTDPLNGEAAALQMREPERYRQKVMEYVQKYAKPEDFPTSTGKERGKGGGGDDDDDDHDDDGSNFSMSDSEDDVNGVTLDEDRDLAVTAAASSSTAGAGVGAQDTNNRRNGANASAGMSGGGGALWNR